MYVIAQCDDWVEGGTYTELSSDTQVVSGHINDPGTLTVEDTPTQPYNQDTGFDIGVVGSFLSFGASISKSFTKERSDSSKYEFKIPKGASGVLGFTPILECSKGMVTSDSSHCRLFVPKIKGSKKKG